MRWRGRRTVNVNETIKIKSLVSRAPIDILCYQWHGIASGGLKWLYIVNCQMPPFLVSVIHLRMWYGYVFNRVCLCLLLGLISFEILVNERGNVTD